MTKRLILTRHAKSSWDDPFADDHSRPLNARGRQSADAVGGWLAAHRYEPDVILSSDSQRTRETVAHILQKLTNKSEVYWRSDLYHASPTKILEALQSTHGETVMIVAHNPGIGGFACGIVHERPDHADFARYPTCATLVAEFDIAEWKMARPGSGRAIDFTIPRDLLPQN